MAFREPPPGLEMAMFALEGRGVTVWMALGMLREISDDVCSVPTRCTSFGRTTRT